VRSCRHAPALAEGSSHAACHGPAALRPTVGLAGDQPLQHLPRRDAQDVAGHVPGSRLAPFNTFCGRATTTGGFFTIYPAGRATRPTVSDADFAGSHTVPSLVAVKLAPDGAFSLTAATPDATHAVIDVLGSYTRRP
jgi:hypothetical protein